MLDKLKILSLMMKFLGNAYYYPHSTEQQRKTLRGFLAKAMCLVFAILENKNSGVSGLKAFTRIVHTTPSFLIRFS